MRFFSDSWPFLLPGWRRSLPAAYVLWFFWGMLGLHKLYLGRPLMAMLYVLTGGFFMVGWALDLLTLPVQVAQCNLRLMMEGQLPGPPGATSPASRVYSWSAKLWRWLPKTRRRRQAETMTDLLLAAQANGGTLSVTEGVLATGLPFDEVKRVLSSMVSDGYVDVTNQPETGVVTYVFLELDSGAAARPRQPRLTPQPSAARRIPEER